MQGSLQWLGLLVSGAAGVCAKGASLTTAPPLPHFPPLVQSEKKNVLQWMKK